MKKICLKDSLMCPSGNFLDNFKQTSYIKLYSDPYQTSKMEHFLRKYLFSQKGAS